MDRFHPESWFTPAPGTTGTIHSRPTIRDWYTGLETTSNRIRGETIGVSTEGNPIDALFIADDMSDTSFTKHWKSRSREVSALVAGKTDNIAQVDERPIILVTSGIHATEIGGPQSIPALVHWLVASDDTQAAMIRDRLITIIIPTLNPDGMDLVHRWHVATLGTDQEGTSPPLLYHRFAGHDNNRDWVFRNLTETRVLLDAIHRTWLPHVTLDQHQMGKFGPRFVLPPYCDPWNPWVPGEIIAASTMLGQTIASDLTIQGFKGVQTNRYFDAWEPSRAIQHFRGGIRILTEAASANLAQPIVISDEQLRACPMPLPQRPTQGQPSPWPGGTWSLEDIVEYHLAAAKSLLVTVAANPELYVNVQRQALSPDRQSRTPLHYSLELSATVGDAGAQDRLAQMMSAVDATTHDRRSPLDGGGSLSAIAHAVLQPTDFPAEHGPTSYDLTSHQLPLMMGAKVQATTPTQQPSSGRRPQSIAGHGPMLSIDARSHQAPRALEDAISSGRPVWRTTRTQLVDGVLVQPGSWIVEGSESDLKRSGAVVTVSRIASVPANARPVERRDILLLSMSDEPTADYGWTRYWLHSQRIPFLETSAHQVARLHPAADGTTLLIPEDSTLPPSDAVLAMLKSWLHDGGNILTFGKTSRSIVPTLANDVSMIDGDSNPEIKAPRALVSIHPNRSHPASWGLDRSMPAVYARDGAFNISAASDTTSIATFAQRDTVLSGWMTGAQHIAGQAAIVETRKGPGTLWAFTFRPLFRAQSLATSTLVHNLLYQVHQGQERQ